jgi:hypothetical protein
LHLRVVCIDRRNDSFLTPFQGCERLAVNCHLLPAFSANYRFCKRFPYLGVNDNDSH